MGSVEQAPFHLTEVDRQVLAQTDDEFQYHDWADLQDIVGKICYYLPFEPVIQKFRVLPSFRLTIMLTILLQHGMTWAL